MAATKTFAVVLIVCSDCFSWGRSDFVNREVLQRDMFDAKMTHDDVGLPSESAVRLVRFKSGDVFLVRR